MLFWLAAWKYNGRSVIVKLRSAVEICGVPELEIVLMCLDIGAVLRYGEVASKSFILAHKLNDGLCATVWQGK